MRNCGGWRLKRWLKNSRAKPSSPLPSSMRPGCGLPEKAAGTIASTSFGRLPRPCTASWSIAPGSVAPSAAAGRLQQTELTESKAPVTSPDDELLAVHEALERLAQRDPVSADLGNLRQ